MNLTETIVLILTWADIHISYTRTSGRENEVIDLPDDLLENL